MIYNITGRSLTDYEKSLGLGDFSMLDKMYIRRLINKIESIDFDRLNRLRCQMSDTFIDLFIKDFTNELVVPFIVCLDPPLHGFYVGTHKEFVDNFLPSNLNLRLKLKYNFYLLNSDNLLELIYPIVKE